LIALEQLFRGDPGLASGRWAVHAHQGAMFAYLQR
jgi:hypothetical protein